MNTEAVKIQVKKKNTERKVSNSTVKAYLCTHWAQLADDKGWYIIIFPRKQTYCIYPKYSNTISPYQIWSKLKQKFS